ncbi:hypothetical protein [Halorientalis sp.]|jgi:Zn finger protein HypA/HybF involved in hydrogenase expression|uniref:hypothetical protein n=1 Tax=Halorientalis sp. TaxID=1931229 RepID=UPI002631D26E|nr:hypothetical protein [Halorientalis sp.]
MGVFESLKSVFSLDDEVVHYRCRRCERTFAYRADLTDPTCPYCDGGDLDSVDPP